AWPAGCAGGGRGPSSGSARLPCRGRIEALAGRRRFRFGRGDHRREAMAYATTDDGVRLYYEETGEGAPLVFVHEFAGDHRSWEPQMRFFARRYRCIA